MIGLPCGLNLFGNIRGERHVDAAGERGLPLHEMPGSAAVTVLTTLANVAFISTLAPSRCFHWFQVAPDEWDHRVVEEHLQLSARIAVERTVIVEVEFAQRRPEASLPLFGEERQNPAGKERLAVPGPFPRNQDRAKTTVGKE